MSTDVATIPAEVEAELVRLRVAVANLKHAGLAVLGALMPTGPGVDETAIAPELVALRKVCAMTTVLAPDSSVHKSTATDGAELAQGDEDAVLAPSAECAADTDAKGPATGGLVTGAGLEQLDRLAMLHYARAAQAVHGLANPPRCLSISDSPGKPVTYLVEVSMREDMVRDWMARAVHDRVRAFDPRLVGRVGVRYVWDGSKLAARE